MKRLILRAVTSALAIVALAATAQTPAVTPAQTSAVTVTQAWVRATVAEQKSTGAFMTLRAAGATRLVAVQSTAAATVELHEMAMDGDVMRMRAVPAVNLAAGQDVALKPGSFHVMLMGLKKPLTAGETLPLTLVFESPDGKQRQQLVVQAEVRALGSR